MKIHLMAVGGTGMGSLAGLLKAQGHDVTGCDAALYPPMSDYIAKYGVPVSEGHSPAHLSPRPDLVVVGNAVHADNEEARTCAAEEVLFVSMAQAIRKFAIDGRSSLVVAGTHGKTTTTALCSFLLHRAGLNPNMIVGGIAIDFDSSFLWGGGGWTVVEGDEYETAFFDKKPKFLHYRPDVLIMNNIELDHLDNFRDLPHLEQAFLELLGEMAPGGVLLYGEESEPSARLAKDAGCRKTGFGISGKERLTAIETEYSQEGTRFRLQREGEDLGPFRSRLYGAHNLRNSVAALGACLEAGAGLEELRRSLPGFSGVKRRQEILLEEGGLVVVDDFAHHPTAIKETLEGLFQRFKPQRIVACFEPRSFTCQTNLHQSELPPAFGRAEVVLVGPLNATAKIPAERRLDLAAVKIDLELLGKRCEIVGSAEGYLQLLLPTIRPGDLVVFFSSGSFMGLPALLARRLSGR